MTFAHPNQDAGATLSDCGRHRYLLSRYIFGATTGHLLVGWIMFNPSTADSQKDDATLRKCTEFSRRAGGIELQVANLYTLRSPHPRDVYADPDSANGPDSAAAIDFVLEYSDIVVCAWGGLVRHPWSEARVERVLRRAKELRVADRLRIIGLTKSGQPTHPLMAPYQRGLSPWVPSFDGAK